MVKRITVFFLCLLMLLPAAALAANRVIDEAGLFTASEEEALEAKIERFQEKYQVDVVVLTTRAVPTNRSYEDLNRTMAYADDYYDQHGYGIGEDKAGILYLLDMNNRVSYVSTGGIMQDYINDHRLDEMLTSAEGYLYRGRYADAAGAIIDKAETFMRRGIEEGQFRYDIVTGQRSSKIYNPMTRKEWILSIGGGLAVALIIYFSVAAKYNLKREQYSFNKMTQSDVNLTEDDKVFLREHVSRTRIPRNTGGGGGSSGGGRGSGVHFSSGGVSHGGGGRHF